MALTKAEIEAIASRVIELGEARSEERIAARQKEWDEKYAADAPARIERRLAKLEESSVSWVALSVLAVGVLLLFGLSS